MAASGTIEVDERYCKGCELCAQACPKGLIHMTEDRLTAKGYRPAELNGEGCTGCAICALVCPEAAITVYRETAERKTQSNPSPAR